MFSELVIRMGATSNHEECITHGPWGGSKGKKWMYMPQGFIKKIILAHGGVIDSIKFQSYCSTGETQSSFFGGKGGNRTDTICLDYPDEYLMSISRTVGSYDGFDVVMSICFVTNQNQYGPYGTNSGTPFSYDGKGGVIVGFHGNVDKFLSSIGVYVMPKSLAFIENFTGQGWVMLEVGSSRSRMAMPRDAGPWGSSGGLPWDDGVFSDIKQVLVHIGDSLNVISAIQFIYVKRDGESVLSNLHGAIGSQIKQVNLDGNNEYLTGISGFYGAVEGYNGLEAIMSISLHTNKNVHGPYGKQNRAQYLPFTSTASPGRVVGFHGLNSGFLRAIGVHMEYF